MKREVLKEFVAVLSREEDYGAETEISDELKSYFENGFGDIDVLLKQSPELKAALEKKYTEESIKDIIGTSLTSYYTPKEIVKSVLKKFTFGEFSEHRKIRVLDPACGIGNMLSYFKEGSIEESEKFECFGSDKSKLAIDSCKALLHLETSHFYQNQILLSR